MPYARHRASGTRHPATHRHLLVAFRLGLKEAGRTRVRTWRSISSSAGNQYDRPPAPAATLFGQGDHCRGWRAVCPGQRKRRNRNEKFPIVFTAGVDLVEVGLVASLNRPRRQDYWRNDPLDVG